MKVFSFIALCLLVAAVSADSVPFTSCSDHAHATIKSIDVTPYPPVPGKDLTIVVHGSSDETIESASFDASVTIMGVPIFSLKGDACKLDESVFKCPHPAGPIALKKVISLPSIAPAGTYGISLSSKDQNGDDLVCATAQITIGSSIENKEQDELTLDNMPAVTDAMVDYINNLEGNTWSAGHSTRFEGKTMAHVRGLCGAYTEKNPLPFASFDHIDDSSIPDSFDAREQWADICPSVNDVRDQASCGSCWAFGAAEAITDRTCIFSKGASKPYLAAEDLLSCCSFFCGNGCEGGYPSAAWSYWASNGIVTGGPWNSNEGCMPYTIESCDHHVNGTKPPCGPIVPTPSCTAACRSGYDKTYMEDKHFGATSYGVPGDVASIQKALMEGPVEGAFSVYADFPTYKSGVYQHTTGGFLGGHAIKIIGWGTENGTPYWTVTNSWNSDWGDKGFFKILRGQDECGIESSIVAGTPKQ